jgi:hypothetical protein
LNDSNWDKFSSGRLHHYETKWTKKLEDYTEEDNDEIVSEEEVNVGEAANSDEDIQLHQYDAEEEQKRLTNNLSRS